MFGIDEETLKNTDIETSQKAGIEQEADTDLDDDEIESEADTATAEEAESEESQNDGDEEDEKPQKKDSQEAINKRFAKITAEEHALRAKAEPAELEKDKALQEIERLKSEKFEIVDAPHPDLAYTDPVKFKEQQEAWLQHTLRQQTNSIRLEEQQRIADRQEQDRQAAVANRLYATAKELGIEKDDVEKYATVIVKNNATSLLREMILDHEAAPVLMRHLAKNKDAFAEINSIRNPLQLARKLDAMQETAAQRKISRAPAPTKKISGSSAKEVDEFKKALPSAIIE